MKPCNTCKKSLPPSQFQKDAQKSDGLRSNCKECAKARRRELRKGAERKRINGVIKQTEYKRRVKDWSKVSERICVKCKTPKPLTDFHEEKSYSKYGEFSRYDKTCKACLSAYRKEKLKKKEPPPKPIEKECKGCGLVKPLLEFSRCLTSKSGKQKRCKMCNAISYKKEKEINYSKFYYPINLD